MTFDEDLQTKLNNLKDSHVTPDEVKAIKLGQIKQVIYKRIISNKFAKNNLTQKSKELIFKKVSDSIDEQKPLFFVFGYGGYKNTWIDTHPSIDWAEVFNLMYMCNLLMPIANIYKPGIKYEFEAEDSAVVEQDNFLQSDIDAYANSFKILTNYFNEQHMPDNFQFSHMRLADHYDTKRFFEELKPSIDAKTQEFKTLPKEELEHKLKRVAFNFKIKGQTDYSNASNEELREAYIASLATNHCFLEKDFEKREQYFIGSNHIPLIGAYCGDDENADNWITINSVANRDNAFWTSKGIAIKAEDTYKYDILTPTSYGKVKDKLNIESSVLLKEILPSLDKIEVFCDHNS